MWEAILAFILNSPATAGAIFLKTVEVIKALFFGTLLTTAEVGECLIVAEFQKAGAVAIENIAEGTQDIIDDALNEAGLVDLSISEDTGKILEEAVIQFFDEKGVFPENGEGACENDKWFDPDKGIPAS